MSAPQIPVSEHYFIESVTEDGKRFRPSDWIERISSVLGTFGPDHRLHYSENVFPCTVAGEKFLAVSRDLAQTDPQAFDYVLRFARDNRLRVQEDPRRREPGENESQAIPRALSA